MTPPLASPATPPRSLLRKALHALIIVAVLHQFVVADFMSEPWEQAESASEELFFTLHALVGMTIGGLVLLFMLNLSRASGMPAQLWPWFSAAGRGALWQAGRRLVSRQADLVDEERAAKAWQGLGLLIMLTLAMTGTTIYLLPDQPDLMQDIAEVHEGAVSLLWLYLVGHVGMTIWHALQGRHLWRDMFSWRSRR